MSKFCANNCGIFQGAYKATYHLLEACQVMELAVGRDQSSRWKRSTANQLVQGLEDTDQYPEAQCEDQLPIFVCNG